MNLNKEYWNDRYREKLTGWDIGAPSPPLVAYFDQLEDKNIRILIPGCGNAYEASYLFHKGFRNIHLLDIAAAPLLAFQKKEPDFPKEQLLHMDFFNLTDHFDLIIEQTFFCALHPNKRVDYIRHMSTLMKKSSILAGVFFGIKFKSEGPPFGAEKLEYEQMFSPYFDIKTLENCYNSIPPRQGNELFFIFEKK